ncbi:hypothetical protein [Mesorhizobium amorphae]|uniref:hypothetical protein n=1 Tax=Mesorhizobium amorphae TaxID=71433 RepID=UPI001183EBB9|nr:hypothetical protein [Mesorhizobium amorphae]
MEELGFERFRAYRSANETVVEHGWPAMLSALFITGPSKAVFGDYLEDGLPLRMIQMFIGLPWVSTYTAVSSALKSVLDASEKKRRISSSEKARIAAREQEVRKELDAKKEALATLPDRGKLRTDLDRLDGEVAASQALVTLRRTELNNQRQRAEAARWVTVPHADYCNRQRTKPRRDMFSGN